MLVAWQGGGSESGARGGGYSGLAMAGSNYWIIIDPSWGSKCSLGAQQAVGANVAASCGYSSPAQSLRFLFLQIEQPTVVKGSNSQGGSLTVDEARLR